MLASLPLPKYEGVGILRNAPVRVGIYIGLCLAIVFSAWVMVAHRVAVLDGFQRERNLAALVILCALALFPVVRFYRSPHEQVLSGLIAWTILCFTYRVLGLFFSLLDQEYIRLQIFVMGSLAYMISATLSWIGTIVWRARNEYTSHLRH
ncbi:MAG TPA: hypothetical protein VKH45_08795 [Candidatus Acidoferrum sp.]|nr:hypothetical protein [Candidatus Acidoferrum sp.]